MAVNSPGEDRPDSKVGRPSMSSTARIWPVRIDTQDLLVPCWLLGMGLPTAVTRMVPLCTRMSWFASVSALLIRAATYAASCTTGDDETVGRACGRDEPGGIVAAPTPTATTSATGMAA